MNIYDFALKMEANGKDYYEKLMHLSEDTSIKTIFKMLASDEQAHYDALKDGGGDVENSKVLDFAANVFEDLESSGEEIPFNAGEDALRHALDIEYKSIQLYEEYAGQTDDEKAKALFSKLVSEESKHYLLIENLLDHLSGGLLRGIESAEFPPL